MQRSSPSTVPIGARWTVSSTRAASYRRPAEPPMPPTRRCRQPRGRLVDLQPQLGRGRRRRAGARRAPARSLALSRSARSSTSAVAGPPTSRVRSKPRTGALTRLYIHPLLSIDVRTSGVTLRLGSMRNWPTRVRISVERWTRFSLAVRESLPASVVVWAAAATEAMLVAISAEPMAASLTLRFISLVVAVCSSTAEAMVTW